MTFAEAQRAIYIDFERPQGSPSNPPRVALLGVLIGDYSEALEQIVVDERLASTTRAKPWCRAGTLKAVVIELVTRAKEENRPIVGWSFFDRDRLIGAGPEKAAEITARYINALHVARPWKHTIYPDFSIERADEHSPRNTLDQYARLAGYAGAKALNRGKPAQWIQDTI